MPSPPEDLETLLDRQRIVDVLVRYVTTMDNNEWDALAECFTDDAIAGFGSVGPEMHGVGAIRDELRAICEPMDYTFHLIGNHVIEIDGDKAHSTSYLIAHQVMREALGGTTFHVSGKYHDELVRTADGWRITNKRLEAIVTDGNPTIATQAAARAAAAN
jgi:3-phenylpropionate/cinnamic acid dioxygenase small subunit